MTLQESYTSSNANNSITSSTFWVAQTWTTVSAYSVTGIRLGFSRSGTFLGNVTVSIRATSAGVPVGDDLATLTFDGSTLTTNSNGEWATRNFDSPYSLNSGTVYTIVFRQSGSSTLNYRRDSAGGYGGGSLHVNSDSGSDGNWTDISSQDIKFAIYGSLLPLAPKNPTPEHETTGITLDDNTLIWEDGGRADTYDVYFRPFGEFFEKIASDITDTFVDAIVAHTVAFNGHYTYGELYLWCVIAKNEYGSNYDPPVDFGIGYGGTIWEFNAMVFEPPLPSGITLSYAGDDDGVPTGTPTGGNLMIATRRLVAAANNKIWVEDI